MRPTKVLGQIIVILGVAALGVIVSKQMRPDNGI